MLNGSQKEGVVVAEAAGIHVDGTGIFDIWKGRKRREFGIVSVVFGLESFSSSTGSFPVLIRRYDVPIVGLGVRNQGDWDLKKNGVRDEVLLGGISCTDVVWSWWKSACSSDADRRDGG